MIAITQSGVMWTSVCVADQFDGLLVAFQICPTRISLYLMGLEGARRECVEFTVEERANGVNKLPAIHDWFTFPVSRVP
jgi:hypothetical protein